MGWRWYKSWDFAGAGGRLLEFDLADLDRVFPVLFRDGPGHFAFLAFRADFLVILLAGIGVKIVDHFLVAVLRDDYCRTSLLLFQVALGAGDLAGQRLLIGGVHTRYEREQHGDAQQCSDQTHGRTSISLRDAEAAPPLVGRW